MKKVVLYIAATLDGFIARKDGSVDFLETDNNTGEDYGLGDFMQSIDSIVMGNTTFKEYSSHPQFYQYYEGKALYVFSREPQPPHDKVIFVNEQPDIFVKSLKSEKDMWLLGGAGLISTFINANQIDEFVITIVPVLIGNGISLFTGILKDINLQLVKTESYTSGFVNLHYKRI